MSLARLAPWALAVAAVAALLWPGSRAGQAVISVTRGLRGALTTQPGGNQ